MSLQRDSRGLSGRRSGRRAVGALLMGLLTGGGCTTTSVSTSDGRPLPPEPHPAPQVPHDAPVNAMAMRVGLKPSDSNNNGYPDLIPVEVYLFASPHASSVHRAGEFEFSLYLAGQPTDGEAAPLARWQIEFADQEAARFQSPMFGLGYGFRLSLLDKTDDELPLMPATLVCRYQPSDGNDAVLTDGNHTIQIGSGR